MSKKVDAEEAEIVEETIDDKKDNSQAEEIVDELEADFLKFSESKSSNNPEEKQEEQKAEEDIFEDEISDADSFKLKIFLSLMFALLDGFHVFIYGFISKYKITKEDIALEEGDREGLEIYFRTQRVMDMINRLPVELIGFVHIEYLYFQKFQDFTAKMKEREEPEEEEEEVEDVEHEEVEEEEEEVEEKEEKTPPKKKPAKKKAVKKKAVKKRVKKAEEKIPE